MLGTNGGGFFNANSAHPYEYPTALTKLAQMLLLIGIAVRLTNVLGRMAREMNARAWALFAAMSILLLMGMNGCLLSRRPPPTTATLSPAFRPIRCP